MSAENRSVPAMPDPPIPPETKDWTVVIEQGCRECGFDPHYDVTTTGERLRESIDRWQAVLTRDNVGTRPSPQTWSPLEYAGHVRDATRIFRGRLEMMLREDNPVYPDWDQDAAAVEQAYNTQEPASVARQYTEEARATAAAFDAVRADEWMRPGRRSDGKDFTVASFAVYLLHEIEHHLHDAGG